MRHDLDSAHAEALCRKFVALDKASPAVLAEVRRPSAPCQACGRIMYTSERSLECIQRGLWFCPACREEFGNGEYPTEKINDYSAVRLNNNAHA